MTFPTRVMRSRWLLVTAALAAAVAVMFQVGVAQAVVHGLLGADAPGNDALAAAETVDPSAAQIDGSTDGAGTETSENDAAAGDPTVWYRFTPATSGTVYLSASTDDPPTVRVYTGTVFPLTAVPSDAADGAVAFDAAAGTPYLLQVDGGSTPGAFDFSLIQQPVAVPDDDDLDAAVSLDEAVNELGAATGDLADGSTDGATTQDGEPGGATATVWYSWTVPADGARLDLAVDGGHTLGVYSGTDVAALQQVSADAAGSVTLSGTDGQVLLVRVGAGTATTGAFTLTGTVTGLPTPDTTAPTVNCTPPAGWTKSADVPCTATDSGSGLARPGDDASFTLTANVPDGTSGDEVVTGTREVCDVAGNCATAGPLTGLKIDRAGPVVDCAATSPNWLGAQAVIDCTATDPGSGLSSPDDAAFTLTTSVPAGQTDASATFGSHADICDAVGNCTAVTPPEPARVDLTPPVVHCDAPPAGWQSGDQAVACTASDAGSGLANPSQESFTLSTSIGDAASGTDVQTGTATVCDAVGNCATAGPVGGLDIDRAAPVVTCTPPDGWAAGAEADIDCTATDSDSGLADETDASFTLTATIPAGQQSRAATSDSRQVCDAVGNCATAGPFTAQLDDQPPAIDCQATPADWQDGALQVQCAADDGDGSGVADADSAFTLTADVANGTVSGSVPLPGRQVCDAAGNCATTPALDPGKIERITPQVVCDKPGGVHHAEVTVTCTASDEGSGLADPALASFTLRTSVGDGHSDAAAVTDTRAVCDLAGNCTEAGPVGPFDVDRTTAAGGSVPELDTTSVIHVLSARPQTAAGVNAGGAGAVPVPFDEPSATGAAGLAVRVGCNPEPDGLFPLGSTLVVCAATDDADRTTTKAFSVQVQLASDLAPRTAFRIGGLATALGRGFAGSTVVAIELDGSQLGAVLSTAAGAVGVAVGIPAGTPPGAHTLVLRGVAADGAPELVIAPITLTTDQQPLAVARPTGGTVPDHTGSVPPPPAVTTTLSGPTTSQTASSTAVRTTAVSSSGAPTTASGAPPATSSSPATGAGEGPAVSGTSSHGAPSGTGTSAPLGSGTGTAAPPVTTSSVPQQTFGGGPQQTTTTGLPPQSTAPQTSTGAQQEAGGQPPTTPAPATSTAPAPGSSGGFPAWLWWTLGAVLLFLLGAGAFVISSRRPH